MRSIIRGQYEVGQEIGAGGMGKVYQARDTRLNRTVALKILLGEHSKDPDRRRRFFLEAQAASALNHPNIITIYDVISEDDADIIVMEYVNGRTLVETIPRGGLRVPQAINYAAQIADALATAHSAGIIHRDLKPANIMATDKGLIKILDFGLAKLTEAAPSDDPDATSAAPLTVEGSIIGTVSYMSPEQAQGRKVDARSDIFSFGAVLYEMATGQRAFFGDNNVSILSSVLRDTPRSILDFSPEIPSDLENIIQRCLRKDPDERWQTMDEVHQHLLDLKSSSDTGALYRSRAALGDPPTEGPLPAAPALPSAPPANAGKKWAVRIAAALGICVVAAAIWFLKRPIPINSGQTPQTSAAAEALKPSPAEFTNDNVIEMVKAKVPEPLIISQIRSTRGRFDLSSAGIIRLTQAGVSGTVIEAMRNPTEPKAKPGETVAALPPAGDGGSEATKVEAPPTTFALADGTPVMLTIAEEIGNDVEPGTALHFTVAREIKVGNTVVIPKGATATGTVLDRTKKGFLGLRSKKPLFSFKDVQSAGGSVRIRAVQKPKDDEDQESSRVLESNGPRPKNVLAPKGAGFVAYIAGDQTVSIRGK